MKSPISILVALFCTISCMAQYEVEHLRGEALDSKEFKKFSAAYKKHLNQKDVYRGLLALGDQMGREKVRDTLSHYYVETDSLLSIMKSSAKAFYKKYPFKKLKWTPDQFTEYLLN